VHTTATGSFFPDDLDDELDDPWLGLGLGLTLTPTLTPTLTLTLALTSVESLCCVPTIEATVEGGPEGMDMVSGMAECTGVAVEGAVVQGTAEGMVEITAVVVEP